MIEEEADLGEIDQFGRDVQVDIDRAADGEQDDDEDDMFANIEGIVDDFTKIEGQDEAIRDSYLKEMMKNDHLLTQKILQGAYLTRGKITKKLEKNEKLKDRVRHTYLSNPLD